MRKIVVSDRFLMLKIAVAAPFVSKVKEAKETLGASRLPRPATSVSPAAQKNKAMPKAIAIRLAAFLRDGSMSHFIEKSAAKESEYVSVIGPKQEEL